jgi:hypothetical protein
MKKKQFVVVGILGVSFLIWACQTMAGGILYATAAFFTNESWKVWKKKRLKDSSIDRGSKIE